MTMMMRRPESTVRGEVLGAELRRHREAAGLTLLETAELVGISSSHLSKMETGKRTQQLEDVASLCTVYKVFGQDLCVELACVPDGIAVRDSKNPAGPVLLLRNPSQPGTMTALWWLASKSNR
jgi:transcriptional regulator with XRE-family HTH domain